METQKRVLNMIKQSENDYKNRIREAQEIYNQEQNEIRKALNFID